MSRKTEYRSQEYKKEGRGFREGERLEYFVLDTSYSFPIQNLFYCPAEFIEAQNYFSVIVFKQPIDKTTILT